MRIGVPKETKTKENRVSMTPQGVARMVSLGHEVFVESAAGVGSGFSDKHYQQAGAVLVSTDQAWATELVVKVKEPVPAEYQYLDRQRIFTFFHLTGVDPLLTEVLLDNGTTAIAYETLEDESGALPLLAPMSAIAGNMASIMGAYYLASFNQGRGVQIARVMGHASGKVVIIGDGVVGQHAANVATGMGSTVYMAGLDDSKFQKMKSEGRSDFHFFLSTPDNIAQQVIDADVVIGAVLVKGARAKKVLTETMIKTMLPGSVVVDVSIDQGGCFETSKATTHVDPVYQVQDVIHYCVSNMPGAYPRTATLALATATLPYVEKIASYSEEQLLEDKVLRTAINTYDGNIVYEKIAQDLGLMKRYKSL